jgi:hypothetical protein
VEDEKQIRFPAVTVCNFNKLGKARLEHDIYAAAEEYWSINLNNETTSKPSPAGEKRVQILKSVGTCLTLEFKADMALLRPDGKSTYVSLQFQ